MPTISFLTRRFDDGHWLPWLILLTAVLYWPGLTGGFELDDYSVIVLNPALWSGLSTQEEWLAAIFSSHSGPTGRPLAMASFALQAWLAGPVGEPDPYPFKAVNIALHLFNGLLVYSLARRWCQSSPKPESIVSWAPLALAAIWLLHPLHVSTVLYVVQRMTLLSTLFSLAALIAGMEATGAWRQGRWWPALAQGGWALLAWGLAIGSKENAIVLPGLWLCMEFARTGIVVPVRWQRPVWLGLLFLLIVLLASATYWGGWLQAGYRYRAFSMGERLLTESRVLWHYLGWWFWPNPSLMGLHHDDIRVSQGPWMPLSTMPATLAWAGMVCGAWVLRHRFPMACAGLAFFLIGHGIESGPLALDLAYEHRNYLPSLGLAMITLSFMSTLSSRTLRVGLVAGFLALAVGTQVRTLDWSSEMRLAQTEYDHHPTSARNTYRLARAHWSAHFESGPLAEPIYQRVRGLLLEAMGNDACNLEAGFSLLALDADRHQSPDGALYAQVRERAARCPSRMELGMLIYLVKCVSAGTCLMDGEALSSLVVDVLRNPRIVPSAKATLAEEAARWAFRGGRLELAQNYMAHAVAVRPDSLAYRLAQVDIALAAHRADEAATLLLAVEAMFRANADRSQVDARYEALARLTAAAGESGRGLQ